ncbi:hypothetical protein [Streptomyces lonarensis]|uniref:Uncharacterized protein n=1 Tax=Streptomyces lonarensis TaxID=700599 RepID=A0A7X6D4D6_9ACTN|nr:hypothetical protein [Streptomyces lonarensis]NJQ07983.1 hypothetical protein [Streptomyces lonarensis]
MTPPGYHRVRSHARTRSGSGSYRVRSHLRRDRGRSAPASSVGTPAGTASASRDGAAAGWVVAILLIALAQGGCQATGGASADGQERPAVTATDAP